MSEGTRRYDIDWLRVIAMLGIFILHSMNLFEDDSTWILRNADQSMVLRVLKGSIYLWAMPLFFVLSGAGSWFALKRRSAGRFIAERAQRLLLPMYTVGVFLIVLPQVYFHAYTAGFRGGFWEAIGNSLGSFRFTASWPGLTNLFLGHLWFLQFLFIISAVLLPILFALRSEPGKRFIGWMAGVCSHRGGIFLLILPIAIVRVGLMGVSIGEQTWAYLAFAAVQFLIGYTLFADERFTASLIRNRWIGLILGILGFCVQGFFLAVQGYQMFNEAFSLRFALFEIGTSIGIWGAVVFLMGMAAKRLNRPSRVLTYANEAVLPFYLFHQTVILGVAWFVIQWDLHLVWKLIAVSILSFGGCLLLIETFVKRLGVVRFLFGMRPRRPPT